MIKIILFILLILVAYGVYQNRHPRAIGTPQGHLSPCPSTPNCVSSDTSPKSSQYTTPFPQGSLLLVKEIISKDPQATIIKSTEQYLHAEFRSKVFSFVDDFECLIDETTNVVHVRSASRVGYGDLGVNRKRVERIRTQLQKIRAI